MSDRQRPALGPPPEPSQLRGFPRWTLAASRRVWRAHRVDRGPWWFAGSGDGRFDLLEPAGTCYLASNAATAVRESLGARLVRAGAVTPASFTGRVVSALHVPHDVRLADVRHTRAVAFGVTREIHTITPYPLTRRWAQALYEAGCGGMRYEPRHTTGTRDVSYAVFGPHGRREWPTDPAPRPAVDVAAAVGIAVVAPPRRPATIDPPGGS